MKPKLNKIINSLGVTGVYDTSGIKIVHKVTNMNPPGGLKRIQTEHATQNMTKARIPVKRLSRSNQRKLGLPSVAASAVNPGWSNTILFSADRIFCRSSCMSLRQSARAATSAISRWESLLRLSVLKPVLTAAIEAAWPLPPQPASTAPNRLSTFATSAS